MRIQVQPVSKSLNAVILSEATNDRRKVGRMIETRLGAVKSVLKRRSA
jgi:hypothetical protein